MFATQRAAMTASALRRGRNLRSSLNEARDSALREPKWRTRAFATDSFPTSNTRSSIPDKPIEPLRASFLETEKLEDEEATSIVCRESFEFMTSSPCKLNKLYKLYKRSQALELRDFLFSEKANPGGYGQRWD